MSLATDTPTLPDVTNPEVPAAVSALTMCLLAKEAADRPANAQAVVEAVRALEAGDDTEPGRMKDEGGRMKGISFPVDLPSCRLHLAKCPPNSDSYPSSSVRNGLKQFIPPFRVHQTTVDD
jgi:hypothetical protein